MPHSRNSDVAGKIESAVSVSREAAGDLTKDSIYRNSLDKEQLPPHPGETDPSAEESTKDSIYRTSLDKEQFHHIQGNLIHQRLMSLTLCHKMKVS